MPAMHEQLQPTQEITKKEVRQVLCESIYAGSAAGFGRQNSSLIDVVLRVEIINHNGETNEYYEGGITLSSNVSSDCFPEDKIIVKNAAGWLQEKEVFDNLPKIQKNKERLKSIFGLSNFQSVFRQERLKNRFKNS